MIFFMTIVVDVGKRRRLRRGNGAGGREWRQLDTTLPSPSTDDDFLVIMKFVMDLLKSRESAVLLARASTMTFY
jgi:hypothetical protein